MLVPRLLWLLLVVWICALCRSATAEEVAAEGNGDDLFTELAAAKNTADDDVTTIFETTPAINSTTTDSPLDWNPEAAYNETDDEYPGFENSDRIYNETGEDYPEFESGNEGSVKALLDGNYTDDGLKGISVIRDWLKGSHESKEIDIRNVPMNGKLENAEIFETTPGSGENDVQTDEIIPSVHSEDEAEEIFSSIPSEDDNNEAEDITSSNPSQDDNNEAEDTISSIPSEGDNNEAEEIISSNPSEEDVNEAEEISPIPSEDDKNETEEIISRIHSEDDTNEAVEIIPITNSETETGSEDVGGNETEGEIIENEPKLDEVAENDIPFTRIPQIQSEGNELHENEAKPEVTNDDIIDAVNKFESDIEEAIQDFQVDLDKRLETEEESEKNDLKTEDEKEFDREANAELPEQSEGNEEAVAGDGREEEVVEASPVVDENHKEEEQNEDGSNGHDEKEVVRSSIVGNENGEELGTTYKESLPNEDGSEVQGETNSLLENDDSDQSKDFGAENGLILDQEENKSENLVTEDQENVSISSIPNEDHEAEVPHDSVNNSIVPEDATVDTNEELRYDLLKTMKDIVEDTVSDEEIEVTKEDSLIPDEIHGQSSSPTNVAGATDEEFAKIMNDKSDSKTDTDSITKETDLVIKETPMSSISDEKVNETSTISSFSEETSSDSSETSPEENAAEETDAIAKEMARNESNASIPEEDFEELRSDGWEVIDDDDLQQYLSENQRSGEEVKGTVTLTEPTVAETDSITEATLGSELVDNDDLQQTLTEDYAAVETDSITEANSKSTEREVIDNDDLQPASGEHVTLVEPAEETDASTVSSGDFEFTSNLNNSINTEETLSTDADATEAPAVQETTPTEATVEAEPSSNDYSESTDEFNTFIESIGHGEEQSVTTLAYSSVDAETERVNLPTNSETFNEVSAELQTVTIEDALVEDIVTSTVSTIPTDEETHDDITPTTPNLPEELITISDPKEAETDTKIEDVFQEEFDTNTASTIPTTPEQNDLEEEVINESTLKHEELSTTPESIIVLEGEDRIKPEAPKGESFVKSSPVKLEISMEIGDEQSTEIIQSTTTVKSKIPEASSLMTKIVAATEAAIDTTVAELEDAKSNGFGEEDRAIIKDLEREIHLAEIEEEILEMDIEKAEAVTICTDKIEPIEEIALTTESASKEFAAVEEPVSLERLNVLDVGGEEGLKQNNLEEVLEPLEDEGAKIAGSNEGEGITTTNSTHDYDYLEELNEIEEVLEEVAAETPTTVPYISPFEIIVSNETSSIEATPTTESYGMLNFFRKVYGIMSGSTEAPTTTSDVSEVETTAAVTIPEYISKFTSSTTDIPEDSLKLQSENLKLQTTNSENLKLQTGSSENPEESSKLQTLTSENFEETEESSKLQTVVPEERSTKEPITIAEFVTHSDKVRNVDPEVYDESDKAVEAVLGNIKNLVSTEKYETGEASSIQIIKDGVTATIEVSEEDSMGYSGVDTEEDSLADLETTTSKISNLVEENGSNQASEVETVEETESNLTTEVEENESNQITTIEPNQSEENVTTDSKNEEETVLSGEKIQPAELGTNKPDLKALLEEVNTPFLQLSDFFDPEYYDDDDEPETNDDVKHNDDDESERTEHEDKLEETSPPAGTGAGLISDLIDTFNIMSSNSVEEDEDDDGNTSTTKSAAQQIADALARDKLEVLHRDLEELGEVKEKFDEDVSEIEEILKTTHLESPKNGIVNRIVGSIYNDYGDVCLNLNLSARINLNNTVVTVPHDAVVRGNCSNSEVHVAITWKSIKDTNVNNTIYFVMRVDGTHYFISYVHLNLFDNLKNGMQEHEMLDLQALSSDGIAVNKTESIAFKDNVTLELIDANMKVQEYFGSLGGSVTLAYGNAFIIQIASGCICVLVVLIVLGFYLYRKARSKERIFKVALDK